MAAHNRTPGTFQATKRTRHGPATASSSTMGTGTWIPSGVASILSSTRSRETGRAVRRWIRVAWAKMIIWIMRGPAASSIGLRRSAAVAAPLST